MHFPDIYVQVFSLDLRRFKILKGFGYFTSVGYIFDGNIWNVSLEYFLLC